MRTHFGLLLYWNHISPQEVHHEYQRNEVESRKSGDMLFEEVTLIGYSLIMHELVEEREGNDWLFEVAEKLFDEAGD